MPQNTQIDEHSPTVVARRAAATPNIPEKVVRRNWAVFAVQLVTALVIAVVAITLLRAFVGQTFVIPSRSMESTFEPRDRVVTKKFGDVQRGDLVVFKDPGGWLGRTPESRGLVDGVTEFVGADSKSTPGYLIKRVIGMPGDTVACCDAQGRLLVNGHALDEAEYLFTNENGSRVSPSDITFDVVVPAGRIFVMGDHRDLSSDSRCHLSDQSATEAQGNAAFVPLDDVLGTAVAVGLPLNRATVLHRPQIFASVPAAAGAPPVAAVIKQYGVTC